MNANQKAKYGEIRTDTTPIQRVAWCPVCGHREAVARYGRGNALAAASVVRGLVMAHMRKCHPEEVA